MLYLEKSLKKHAKKDYVMFAHNCGVHWIAVIIIPKWQKFEVLTTRINLEDIREKIAMFIVSQIIDQKGEFHKAVVYMHWNHMHRTLYGCLGA